MNINDLPDFPAMDQISGALWKIGETRGAAVMVGAGFSRNAELAAGNAREPPLWTDFYNAMKKRLYPNGGAPHDPLRLAEEYKAALGDPVLKGLIFDLVRDTEWRPGPLHHKLLSLPWADILTTNWDTLLERAATVNIRQTYDSVRDITDIPRTRSPRIVKLHGSMPSGRTFIFTEEDYRTYPKMFAPFVNLVQQVLLENDLCLIGFSGEDPNFLQWSGWVRDQLGTAARRIHLVGVLNLKPSHRKFLEARNVSPIDLAPLVQHIEQSDRHRIALQYFIDFLITSKPRADHDWPPKDSSPGFGNALTSINPKQDPTGAAQQLKGMADLWRQERQSFPGWLICPHEKRLRLLRNTNLDYSYQTIALDNIDESERGNVVYEIAWRFDTALKPIFPSLRDIFSYTAKHGNKLGLDRQQRCHLGSILLRTAREEHDQQSFENWSAFLKAETDGDDEALSTLKYEHCLWARDHLDFPKLASLVQEVCGQDPAWKLRRAALHCDLGEHATAAIIITEALNDIRERHSRDRKSIWVLSRLAWATFLARTINIRTKPLTDAGDPFAEREEWPTIFREVLCDPWDELYYLDREIEEALRAQAKDAIAIEPRFDAGTYIDHTTTSRFMGSTVLSPAHQLVRLAEVVGLPCVADHVDIMQSRLLRASELSNAHDKRGLLTSIRVLGSDSDPLIEKRFGRIDVARMPMDIVKLLIERLWLAIDFGSQRFRQKSNEGKEVFDTFWVNHVRVYVELLSRLIVRLPDIEATDAFRRAVLFANDPRWEHWWLYEPLGHLLERSLTAVSPESRKHLLLDVLDFPLPDERRLQGIELHWPELIEALELKLIVRSWEDSAIRHRIDTLIKKLGSAPAFTRTRAALRLTYLFEADSLTAEEITQFGKALWARRAGEDAFPSDTNLLPHVFLRLPSPDPDQAKRIFRGQILSQLTKNGITDDQYLNALIGTAELDGDGPRAFDLSKAEAINIFDAILDWRPKTSMLDLGEVRLKNRRVGLAIGPVLADVVLPILDTVTVGTERIDKLLGLMKDGAVQSLLVALPEVLRLDQERLTQIVKFIRSGLLNSENETAFSAFSAIHRWRKRSGDGVIPDCPTELTQVIVAIVATRREPGLLHALSLMTDLVNENSVNEDDRWRLTEALNALYSETAYEYWDKNDPRTTTITLVRARCVRLADTLMSVGITHPSLSAWVDDSKKDPIPEVRYALG